VYGGFRFKDVEGDAGEPPRVQGLGEGRLVDTWSPRRINDVGVWASESEATSVENVSS
jgi:hypothetical protein